MKSWNPNFVLVLAVLLPLVFTAAGQDRSVEAHDPVMAREGDTYYLFHTGRGIGVKTSTNLVSWSGGSRVFDKTPDWVREVVRDFRGDMWAPDILKHNGTWHLYYSVSAFGRNNSAIGVATSPTLDSKREDYKWTDHGIVVRSVPGRDLWNAIDPNVVIDEAGTPWLSFGSFWHGLKLVKLKADLTSIVTGPGQEWHTLAARERDLAVDDRDAGDAANPELDYGSLYSAEQLERNRTMKNSAIEAPFLFRKDGYWYLFASWDRCCRGVSSTYKVIVGRAKDIRGPYLDREGKRLVRGGGTVIVSGDGDNWAAAGHCAAYCFDGRDYLVFHAYDLKDHGKAKLRVREMAWTDGWPAVKPGE